MKKEIPAKSVRKMQGRSFAALASEAGCFYWH